MTLAEGVGAGLEALAQAIKVERQRIDALPAGGGASVTEAPAWAGTDLDNEYDPQRAFYNLKASNLRRTRAGLARAAGGTGKLNIVSIGDSATIGFNGTTTIDRDSMKHVGTVLAAISGAVNDTGITSAPSAPSTLSDRWATTGTVFAGYPFLMMYAGSSATYTSEQVGTTVEIHYTTNSAAFTYQIDGGAAVNVPAAGGTGFSKVTVGGLADTTHTVKINAPTNYAYILAVGVLRPTGISVHNLGWGGSRAAHGPDGNSWTTNMGNALALSTARKGLIDAWGVSPDLVIIGLGGNDIFQGDTPANAINGLRTIKSWFPNSDLLMTSGLALPDPTKEAAWAQYTELKYQLADELDAVLFDTRDILGSYDEALARGQMGADDIHPNIGLNREMARQIAIGLAPGGGTIATTSGTGVVPPTGDGTIGYGQEIAYAERTTNFTTTNVALAASAGIISGLSISVTGSGRPVDIEFQSLVDHSTANVQVIAALIQDGTSTGLLQTTSSPVASSGATLYFKRRLVIPSGVTRTFQISIAGGAAGTVTLRANANNPIFLQATGR